MKLNKFLYVILFIFSLWDISSFAATPIPADEAFNFSLTPARLDGLVLHWKIAPNYYLYRDRIHIKAIEPHQAQFGKLQFPQASAKKDPLTQEHEVYEHELSLPVPLLIKGNKIPEIVVSYQGCSGFGFCYPPQSKIITLHHFPVTKTTDYAISDVSSSTPTPVTPQNQAETILQESNVLWALLAFFGFGVLLSFTPCVLPMVPILSAIIVDRNNPIKPGKAFLLSFTYVLSMSTAFAFVGMIFGFIGQSVQTLLQVPWVILGFAGFFVVLALSLFGLFELKLPRKLHHYLHYKHQQQSGGSYLSVAIMGFLATLVVSPCVTPPLVASLTFITHTGNMLLGGMALFMMGLGMGLPLLVIGTSLGSFLPKTGAWMEAIKKGFGIIMLGMAIWMLHRIISSTFTAFLWILLAISAIFILWPRRNYPKRLKRARQILLGVVMATAIGLGIHSIYNYLYEDGLMQPRFLEVTTINDLNNQLKQAQLNHQITLIDFYADWCASCKSIDHQIFQNPAIQSSLSDFRLIRIDMTANSLQNRILLRKFSVIAPPTVLFFDANGKELKEFRKVGSFNRAEFLRDLAKMKQTKS